MRNIPSNPKATVNLASCSRLPKPVFKATHKGTNVLPSTRKQIPVKNSFGQRNPVCQLKISDKDKENVHPQEKVGVDDNVLPLPISVGSCGNEETTSNVKKENSCNEHAKVRLKTEEAAVTKRKVQFRDRLSVVDSEAIGFQCDPNSRKSILCNTGIVQMTNPLVGDRLMPLPALQQCNRNSIYRPKLGRVSTNRDVLKAEAADSFKRAVTRLLSNATREQPQHVKTPVADDRISSTRKSIYRGSRLSVCALDRPRISSLASAQKPLSAIKSVPLGILNTPKPLSTIQAVQLSVQKNASTGAAAVSDPNLLHTPTAAIDATKKCLQFCDSPLFGDTSTDPAPEVQPIVTKRGGIAAGGAASMVPITAMNERSCEDVPCSAATPYTSAGDTLALSVSPELLQMYRRMSPNRLKEAHDQAVRHVRLLQTAMQEASIGTGQPTTPVVVVHAPDSSAFCEVKRTSEASASSCVINGGSVAAESSTMLCGNRDGYSTLCMSMYDSTFVHTPKPKRKYADSEHSLVVSPGTYDAEALDFEPPIKTPMLIKSLSLRAQFASPTAVARTSSSPVDVSERRSRAMSLTPCSGSMFETGAQVLIATRMCPSEDASAIDMSFGSTALSPIVSNSGSAGQLLLPVNYLDDARTQSSADIACDDEVSLYADGSVYTARDVKITSVLRTVDPVATTLTTGDEMYFVPVFHKRIDH